MVNINQKEEDLCEAGGIIVHPKMKKVYEEIIAERRKNGDVDLDRIGPSERKYLEETEMKALLDHGTGVFNHDAFMELLDLRLNQLKENEIPSVLVVYSDLNGLGKINNKKGHEIGNEALSLFAEGLLDSIRMGETECENGIERKDGYEHVHDLVGRIGGDEFGIISDGGMDEHAAVSLVSAIPVRIEKFNKSAEKSEKYKLKASSGGVFTCKYMKPSEIMERADNAMYKVKKSGRGGRSVHLGTPWGDRVYNWGHNGRLYDKYGKRFAQGGKEIYSAEMDTYSKISTRLKNLI